MTRTAESEGPADARWLVFFGEDWGKHYYTGQYLAQALPNRINILWVNSIGMRRPRLTLADGKRALIKLLDFGRGLFRKAAVADQPSNVHVLTPIIIPFQDIGPIRRLNAFLLGCVMRRAFRRYGITNPDVVVGLPTAVDVLSAIPARSKFYYCADEYGQLHGNDPVFISELEAQLLQKVDAVIAVSRELEASKRKLHAKVLYLPHGIDEELLWKPEGACNGGADAVLPPGKRCIGYLGLVGHHLDLTLFQELAEALPECQVVVVGPVEQDLEGMPQAPNIIYTGPKSRQDVCSYLWHFDVGILPWLENERNRFANPTKVLEYLAAGCPVVSTPQPEVRRLARENPYLSIGQDRHAFVDSVRSLLEQPPNRQLVSNSVRNETWRNRAGTLCEFLVAGGSQR